VTSHALKFACAWHQQVGCAWHQQVGSRLKLEESQVIPAHLHRHAPRAIMTVPLWLLWLPSLLSMAAGQHLHSMRQLELAPPLQGCSWPETALMTEVEARGASLSVGSLQGPHGCQVLHAYN
jgi:hypothetical protein